MKKILALLLALMMLASLVACSTKQGTPAPADTQEPAQSEKCRDGNARAARAAGNSGGNPDRHDADLHGLVQVRLGSADRVH